MRLTFRFKLFVVSLTVVSALIAAVLWAGWAALLRQEQDRLDARLCQEARRVAHGAQPDESVQRLAADMAAKLITIPIYLSREKEHLSSLFTR